MSLLRLAARRVAARTPLRCLSGSHSDFETVRKKVPATAEGVQAMIKEQVESPPVMLYMKGTPQQPQCGFSQQVCRVLHATGLLRGERGQVPAEGVVHARVQAL